MGRNARERIRRLLRGDVRLGTTEAGREVFLSPRDRTYHLYCLGRSGFGKTSLLRNLIVQDLLADHGLAVLAPDDEMFRDHLLPSIPEHRINDVIYVDPEDTQRPVPLNPLHLAPGERLDEKVDETLRAFLRLVDGQVDASGAPRMQRILRQTLRTLIEIPGSTVLDIPRLLRRDPEGERFRQQAVPRISDEATREFWQSDYRDFPKDAHQSVLSRLDAMLTPPVRNVLCTPGACLNFREAMDSRKVLLFRLTARALQGEGNANIVGQLVVGKIRLAALSREDVPEDDRPFFPLFIDEFQKFCGSSQEQYAEMFSRLRKYRVGLTIAHLETGELPESLVRHILGTVSTYAIFRISHFDARRLSHELIQEVDGPGGRELRPLDPALLGSIPKFHAYCRVDNEVMLLRMRRPAVGDSAIAERIVANSRDRYGVPRPTPPSSPPPAVDAEPGAAEPGGRPGSPGPTLDDLDPENPFS